MSPPDLHELLEFAVDAAHQAGRLTRLHFNRHVAVERKADGSPVTIADRGAEELLRRLIERRFPKHGVVGEEFGETPGREPARWILDPIDGTYSFICGVPLYSVLVGFEWCGEMLAGVIHMPALGETAYAARGLGCWWTPAAAHVTANITVAQPPSAVSGAERQPGGRQSGGAQPGRHFNSPAAAAGRYTPRDDVVPARVSDVSELSQARLLYGGAKWMHQAGRGREFERLLATCHKDRGWGDGYAYALLATGRAEIVLDPLMSLWDTAALLPVVTEAGGTLTDWSGNPTHTAPEALATNGKLLPAVLAAIGRAR